MIDRSNFIEDMTHEYLQKQYSKNEQQIKEWLKDSGWTPPEDSKSIVEHKFNEPELINELREYINSTYDQHYARNKLQTFEAIVDCDHGEGFTIGNILKYASRYGAKDGYNRKDLMKVLHYGLLALYVHDLNHNDIQ